MKQVLILSDETIRNDYFAVDNAIIVSVELGPEGDRKTASTPLDLHVVATRTVFEGTKKGLNTSCTTLVGCTPGCLAGTAACPMACLTGFFRNFRYVILGESPFIHSRHSDCVGRKRGLVVILHCTSHEMEIFCFFVVGGRVEVFTSDLYNSCKFIGYTY